MKKAILLIITNILLFINSLSQTSNSGNLLRINFKQQSVSLSDTIGYWEVSSFKDSYYSELYYDHLKLNSKSYFLKKVISYTSSIEYYRNLQNWIIQDEDKKSERIFVEVTGDWDVLSPFMINNTFICETNNGNWLINGEFGNAFLSIEDSLYRFESFSIIPNINSTLLAIVGEVEDKALAILSKDDDGFYSHNTFIIDLSSSPILDSLKIWKVEFSDKEIPIKITKLIDDLYLAQVNDSDSLKIYKFTNEKFTLVKNILGDFYPEAYYKTDWEYRNNKLYTYRDENLISYTLNMADTLFDNKNILIERVNHRNVSTDRNFRYAALIENDSLKIFDIDKQIYINKINLEGVKKPFNAIIDSPYVYIHHETYNFTNVEKEDYKVNKDYILSAYPNPFNPVTVVYYHLPSYTKVELKIFDLLGQEISTLINKEQNPGTYEVRFNGNSLSTGIYVCRLKAGTHIKYLKLMLNK